MDEPWTLFLAQSGPRVTKKVTKACDLINLHNMKVSQI